jgi:hypothetical protein
VREAVGVQHEAEAAGGGERDRLGGGGHGP